MKDTDFNFLLANKRKPNKFKRNEGKSKKVKQIKHNSGVRVASKNVILVGMHRNVGRASHKEHRIPKSHFFKTTVER